MFGGSKRVRFTRFPGAFPEHMLANIHALSQLTKLSARGAARTKTRTNTENEIALATRHKIISSRFMVPGGVGCWSEKGTLLLFLANVIHCSAVLSAVSASSSRFKLLRLRISIAGAAMKPSTKTKKIQPCCMLTMSPQFRFDNSKKIN